MSTLHPRLLYLLASLPLTALTASAGDPPAFHFSDETNLEILAAPKPAYPLVLLNAGVVSGTTEVVVEVDPEGRVSDALVTASSHPAFAAAVEAAIHEWKFQQAATGEPLSHRLEVTLRHSASGYAVADAKPEIQRQATNEHTYRPHAPAELDAPLQTRQTAAPAYPEAWKAHGLGGTVTISYYIDSEGKVRIPKVESSPDPRLSNVALEAIRQWQFTAPTVAGEPVFVAARQRFHFNDTSLASNR